MKVETKENVSLWQFFILIILFNMGSSLIKNLAVEAKNNGWIAFLIACLVGCCILLVYFQLLRWFPKQILFGIIEICLGKWISPILCIVYISYFIFIASYALRDFGELLVATIFEQTPIEFVHITMISAIIYILTLGIEVLGRSAEIFSPYFVIFFALLGIGIFLSGEIEIQNNFPILGDGVKPIIKVVFPNLIYFPFSEILAIMLIFPLVSNFRKGLKAGMGAYLLSGVFLLMPLFYRLSH